MKDQTCQLSFKRTMKSSIISSSNPRLVAVRDFNNDRQTDIVVANSETNMIGISLSKGNGIFAHQQTYFTGFGSCSCSVVVGNFNHDNYLDIAVANSLANHIAVFLGYGSQPFGSAKTYNIRDDGSQQHSVALNDLNSDG